jgi:hypothetical protein
MRNQLRKIHAVIVVVFKDVLEEVNKPLAEVTPLALDTKTLGTF